MDQFIPICILSLLGLSFGLFGLIRSLDSASIEEVKELRHELADFKSSHDSSSHYCANRFSTIAGEARRLKGRVKKLEKQVMVLRRILGVNP